jgi:hypothetical protein
VPAGRFVSAVGGLCLPPGRLGFTVVRGGLCGMPRFRGPACCLSGLGRMFRASSGRVALAHGIGVSGPLRMRFPGVRVLVDRCVAGVSLVPAVC